MNIMFSPTLVGKLKLKLKQQQQCFSRSLSKIISRRRQRDSFISSQDLTAPSSKEREREREPILFAILLFAATCCYYCVALARVRVKQVVERTKFKAQLIKQLTKN